MFTVRTGAATVRVGPPEITARSAQRDWGQRMIIGCAITGLDVRSA
jgi:hypothetical protein